MNKMNNRFNVNVARWFVVGGLLLLTSITLVRNAQAAGLTDSEQDWLTYMREEEKLARDVYLFLSATWNSRIFSNISVSEKKHMDAIKTLLDRYGISDPAAGNEEGEFTNPELQALYDKLIEKGSDSLIDALGWV